MMRAIRRTVRAAIAERAARGKSSAPVRTARAPRVMRTHRDDEFIAAQLSEWHGRLNTERFGGSLKPIAVRVSRRMRSRLGHYAPAQRGAPAEIAISARHVKRHGFEQALETLLHEMVHQWQDESKLPLGHGVDFRVKASEVGITARARRAVD
jgi:SprT-like family protein